MTNTNPPSCRPRSTKTLAAAARHPTRACRRTVPSWASGTVPSHFGSRKEYAIAIPRQIARNQIDVRSCPCRRQLARQHACGATNNGDFNPVARSNALAEFCQRRADGAVVQISHARDYTGEECILPTNFYAPGTRSETPLLCRPTTVRPAAEYNVSDEWNVR